MVYFFVFKQKTAYEMRISDWSSDVCSSDLSTSRLTARPRTWLRQSAIVRLAPTSTMPGPIRGQTASLIFQSTHGQEWSDAMFRSEEHTSELQSLMRISYAVFCLKKKKKITNNT